MSGKPANLPPDLQAWADARRRHRLSHAHVQMPRELGLKPPKLGKLDNHKAEPWKQPLPQFIKDLYVRRFGRERPGVVTPVEETAGQLARAKVQRQERRAGFRRQLRQLREHNQRKPSLVQRLDTTQLQA